MAYFSNLFLGKVTEIPASELEINSQSDLLEFGYYPPVEVSFPISTLSGSELSHYDVYSKNSFTFKLRRDALLRFFGTGLSLTKRTKSTLFNNS
jgi:hypothetical protein